MNASSGSLIFEGVVSQDYCGSTEVVGKHITSGIERYICTDKDSDVLESNIISHYGVQSMFVMGEEDGQIYEMYEPVR